MTDTAHTSATQETGRHRRRRRTAQFVAKDLTGPHHPVGARRARAQFIEAWPRQDAILVVPVEGKPWGRYVNVQDAEAAT